jgi:hypothetical protein
MYMKQYVFTFPIFIYTCIYSLSYHDNEKLPHGDLQIDQSNIEKPKQSTNNTLQHKSVRLIHLLKLQENVEHVQTMQE